MKRLAIAALAMMSAVPVAAQTASPAAPAAVPIGYGAPITLADAMKLIEKGMKLAGARKLTMVFAVVEPSGELVALARMDDVVHASAHLAKQRLAPQRASACRLRSSRPV